MTAYSTCSGCARVKAACPELAAIKTRIKGLGITSLRHKCVVLKPRFARGQPVTIQTAASDSPLDDDGNFHWEWFEGTFINQIGSKGIAFIKPGAVGVNGSSFEPRNSARGLVKIPLSRISARPDGATADAVECGYCAGFPGLTGECQGDSEYRDKSRCRLRSIALEEARLDD